MLKDRALRISVAGMVGVVAAYAFLAWQRRWICDDGLIAARTARELLAGHGPVFNAFERAEANTSTLWTYVLALGSAITRASVTRLAVFGGIALAVAAVGFSVAAGRRWHGRDRAVVPCAAFVVLGVSAYWDFASSGLETGLTFFWLAVAWWLLVSLRPESQRLPGIAVVLGLGPLVRPDLGLASVVFLGAAWLLVRPPLRRTLALAACAIALPLAYEIFRAGYYGTLVPLPALAKGASASEWARGLHYAGDFQRAYDLWIPLVVLQALLVMARPAGRDRILLATPIVAGALLALYVVRVGGDFMHARMLLPALFIAMQPAFVLPASRRTFPFAAIIAVWSLVTWYRANPEQPRSPGYLVQDERYGYVTWTGSEHPREIDYRHAEAISRTVASALSEGRRLIITESGVTFPFGSQIPARIAVVMGRLGTGTVLVGLDGIAYDTLGLANPLGARITMTYPEERPGHQKLLPTPWIVADIGDPERIGETGASPILVRAARHAMSCGELAELMASVREPMSVHRFWDNLVGSVRRTRLVIPADPRAAELMFCGTTLEPKVTVSSSCEQWGWSKQWLADGRIASVWNELGFSSAIPARENHTEWIELELPPPSTASQVVLYPRTDVPGAGFPVDFTIETWDHGAWVPRVTVTDQAAPASAQAYDLGTHAARIRIVATKLQDVAKDGYALQLTDIELRDRP